MGRTAEQAAPLVGQVHLIPKPTTHPVDPKKSNPKMHRSCTSATNAEKAMGAISPFVAALRFVPEGPAGTTSDLINVAVEPTIVHLTVATDSAGISRQLVDGVHAFPG